MFQISELADIVGMVSNNFAQCFSKINLAISVEKQCPKLAEKIPARINYSYHLMDISEALNAKGYLIMPFSYLAASITIFLVLIIIEVLLL